MCVCYPCGLQRLSVNPEKQTQTGAPRLGSCLCTTFAPSCSRRISSFPEASIVLTCSDRHGSSNEVRDEVQGHEEGSQCQGYDQDSACRPARHQVLAQEEGLCGSGCCSAPVLAFSHFRFGTVRLALCLLLGGLEGLPPKAWSFKPPCRT